jgi:hypothetical protein
MALTPPAPRGDERAGRPERKPHPPATTAKNPP